MGVWKDYNWDYQKRLTGVLIALLFPLPFLYFSSTLVANCPEQSFFSSDITASVCSAGTHFAVLSLVLLFVPMYVLALIQGNGWLNDLYWTVVPVLALLHYTMVGLRFSPFLDAFRLGMLWSVVLLWALRLTHNYLRREEWTFGAREDFRYQTLRKRFGAHWLWMSLPAQFVFSQHVPEVLFTLPYLYIIRDVRSVGPFDYACAVFAVACLFCAWLSDDSLREFVEDPKTTGKVLQSGLWAYSRHPNYLAEALFHWALGLWALPSAGSLWVLSGAVVNSVILITTTFLTEDHFMKGKRRDEYVKYCKKVRMCF